MNDTAVNKIEVMEDIYGENDKIAIGVKAKLTEKGIFAVNVMGAPGVGKTSVLKRLIEALSPEEVKAYVIEGDIESDIDTRDLRGLGIETLQINTFGACHLDAPLIQKAVDDIAMDTKGVLFIENIGNLVCPAEFNIGEHIKLLICSVTDGSDKPYKYPLAFEKADVILVNKVDLQQYLDFDEDFFMMGLRKLNKKAPVFKVSCKTGEGFAPVADCIKQYSFGIE